MTTTSRPSNELERAPKKTGFFRSRSSLFRRTSNLDISRVARRDSALGSPENTSQILSFPEARHTSGSAETSMTIPAIVVEDEGNIANVSNLIKMSGTQPEVTDVPHNASANRSSGFRGITLRIPTGKMENPFASDSMQFSNRGSVMIRTGGKELSRRPISDMSNIEAIVENPSREVPAEMSADDRRSSRKVKSMYELASDDPCFSADNRVSETGQTAHMISEDIILTHTITGETNPNATNNSAIGRKGVSVEAAGGIEDWQGINAEDVDRYGFVNSNSHVSATPKTHPNNRPLSTLMVNRSRPFLENTNGYRSTANGANGSRISSVDLHLLSERSGSGKRSTSAMSVFSLRSDEGRRRKTIRNASDMMGLTLTAQVEEFADPSRAARERRREAKWARMAQPINTEVGAVGGGTTFAFDTGSPKVISRTWKGIPDRWRASAWHSFLLASARRQLGSNFSTDAQLTQRFVHLQTLDCVDDLQIDTDVPRTIGGHIMFRRRYRGGQRLLFRVLRALALYFPDTGYVQGMAPLVATLLCYYDEEQAFVMAVRLWQPRGLTCLYSPGFGGLMDALGVFESKWLATADGGKLARHLETLGIMPMAYGTKWYLTLFNYSIPFAAQLRVWDVFMLLGDTASAPSLRDITKIPDLDVLHATALALMDGMYDRLLHADFEDAMSLLTAPVPIGVGKEDVLLDVIRAEWEAVMMKRRAR